MKPERSRSRLGNLARNLLLFAAVSLLCLLLTEGVVRLLFPFYHPDSQIGFVPNTNGIVLGPVNKSTRQATPKGDFDVTSQFNQDGFRDAKDFRSAGPADWFALGDSFTMGWGVAEEERFSNRLEKALAGSHSASRVFNIAIPDNIIGYQRLLKYAESRGAKVNHLVVGICMENDLQNYSAGESAWDGMLKKERSPAAPSARASAKETVRAWFKEHCASYNALSFGIQRSEKLRRFFEKIGVSRNVDQLSGRNEWDEKAIESSAAELVKLLAGRDSRVLIIPARRLWAGDSRETELRVHEAFIGLLKRHDLQVVDMKPALEKTGEPLAHYFKNDAHWNSRGHALAAQILFQSLSTTGPTGTSAP